MSNKLWIKGMHRRAKSRGLGRHPGNVSAMVLAAQDRERREQEHTARMNAAAAPVQDPLTVMVEQDEKRGSRKGRKARVRK